MKNSKSGNILAKEIKKITERYLYFDFSLEQDIIILPPKIEKPNDIILSILQFRFCICYTHLLAYINI